MAFTKRCLLPLGRPTLSITRDVLSIETLYRGLPLAACRPSQRVGLATGSRASKNAKAEAKKRAPPKDFKSYDIAKSRMEQFALCDAMR